MTKTQIIEEVSITELNAMPKMKRLALVKKFEGKQVKALCSQCSKERISAVHFSLDSDWNVSKILCMKCFSSSAITFKRRGLFEKIRR